MTTTPNDRDLPELTDEQSDWCLDEASELGWKEDVDVHGALMNAMREGIAIERASAGRDAREATILRYEHDRVRACYQRTVDILVAIHARIYPQIVRVSDGRTFRFAAPDPHEFLQAIADEIRSIPDQLNTIAAPASSASDATNPWEADEAELYRDFKAVAIRFGFTDLGAALLAARRYVWLRDIGDATWRPFALREGYSALAADQAIDAAMKEST